MKVYEVRKIIREEIKNVMNELSLVGAFGKLLGKVEGKKILRDKDYQKAKSDAEVAVRKLQQRIDSFKKEVHRFKEE